MSMDKQSIINIVISIKCFCKCTNIISIYK
nr:MAG TPA: hypothetical protein [Caudoviricetes sp.]